MFESHQYTILFALASFSAIVSSAAIRVILHTRLVLLFIDTPDHRKVHSAPIPRLGGIAIILSMLSSLFLLHVFSARLGIAPLTPEVMSAALAAIAGIGILGFFDDSKFYEVRVSHKLVVVIGLAVLTVFGLGVSPGAISVFGWFVIPKFFSDIIAVMWIVGLVNAYNLVDGLDGFAGTIAILTFIGIAVVASLCGCSSAMTLSFLAIGAVVGFMVHNAPPAKVFMGDTGSCYLGFMISMMTIHTAGLMSDTGKVPLVMPLLAGLPILEVFVSIVRRFCKANEDGHPIKQVLKYIVTADSSHIHHRFLFRGFTHLETCVLVGVLAATIVGSAICVTLAPLSYAPFLTAYLVIPVAAALYKLGFGGRFKRALRISSSRFNNYYKPELFGVIDLDGQLFNYLSSKHVKGFAFVPLVSDRDLPLIADTLKGAIVRGGVTDMPEMAVRIVRELTAVYGFSSLSYCGKRGTFSIMAGRKANKLQWSEKTKPINKLLDKFAAGRDTP